MSDGRTIFITGSSSGLGRASAELFSARGWKVVATMRNPEKERELAERPGVVLLPLDITEPVQIERAAAKAISDGGVDVVFNNAGYGMAGPLEGMTDEQILRMLSTNLMGAIRTTKAFIPHFREKGTGLFINTTSIGGLITVPFNSIYHATKWALEGWSESMAFELNQLGIGVKTVAPGGMKTAATDGTDQLRYVAGADAKATYATRLQLGDEAFRKTMRRQFFG